MAEGDTAIEKLKAQFPEAVLEEKAFRGETTVELTAEDLVEVFEEQSHFCSHVAVMFKPATSGPYGSAVNRAQRFGLPLKSFANASVGVVAVF